MSTAVYYICSDCGNRVLPVEGVSAVYARGYWWCVHCVEGHFANGVFLVDEFPAKGKMIPDTLMHDDDEFAEHDTTRDILRLP